MNKFFTTLLAISIFAESSFVFCEEFEQRKPLIYGIAQRPFPAILQLDYPLCRAEAWILALERAATYLPQPVYHRLRQFRIDTPLGRLAACAMLCPLDVTTPERAVDKVVRVFLKWPSDPSLAFESIAADPWQLLVEMAIIWETTQIISKLRQSWPTSLGEGSQRMQKLDVFAEQLRELWSAGQGEFKKRSGATPTLSLLSYNRQAASDPDLLDKAVSALIAREVTDPANSSLWSNLASSGLYLRGLIQERQHQPALAEADFNAALARLKKTGFLNSLTADIYLARGVLRRHDPALMCADYIAACALGKCQELALARRTGLCASEE